MNKTSLLLAFFGAAVLAGLFLRFTVSRESFMQQEVGMPLTSAGMGPYDQVSVDSVSGWGATEAAPILTGAAALPSGADKTNELMFMVGNKVDPECCPSAFNTDTGCVCLSQHDRDIMGSRGGNRA
jgi:hypothetical protein